jgi:hypothetical protein
MEILAAAVAGRLVTCRGSKITEPTSRQRGYLEPRRVVVDGGHRRLYPSGRPWFRHTTSVYASAFLTLDLLFSLLSSLSIFVLDVPSRFIIPSVQVGPWQEKSRQSHAKRRGSAPLSPKWVRLDVCGDDWGGIRPIQSWQSFLCLVTAGHTERPRMDAFGFPRKI